MKIPIFKYMYLLIESILKLVQWNNIPGKGFSHVCNAEITTKQYYIAALFVNLQIKHEIHAKLFPLVNQG